MNSVPNQAPHSRTLQYHNLGYYLDGWADLAEGFGDMTEDVQKSILENLEARDMPDVEIRESSVSAGMSFEQRGYTILTTFPGVTTLVRCGTYGKDLLVTWSTYARSVPNWKVLGVLGAIALLFAMIDGGWSSILTFILTFGGGFLLLSATGTLVARDPFWVLFVQPTMFDSDDVVAMSLAAHKSILKALDKVGVDVALLRSKQDFHRKRNEGV